MKRVGVIVQIRIRFYRQSIISEPDDNLLKDEDARSQLNLNNFNNFIC